MDVKWLSKYHQSDEHWVQTIIKGNTGKNFWEIGGGGGGGMDAYIYIYIYAHVYFQRSIDVVQTWTEVN